MNSRLRVACAYQGGKQRVAGQVVDSLLAAAPSPNSKFYDLCCGSGAVSIELVNRGISPSRIVMLDRSSWGAFWTTIGLGQFDMDYFDQLLSELPDDKREIKAHIAEIAAKPIVDNEAELYPLLQACSFGGKQVWRSGSKWENAFFRDYWVPTMTSVRRSPANPMQPSAEELRRRINVLRLGMKGVSALHADIMEMLNRSIEDDSVVYVDPPYRGTTTYAYGFDLDSFVSQFRQSTIAPLFVSEGTPLNEDAVSLTFGGSNGGISGARKVKHQEWLSRF